MCLSSDEPKLFTTWRIPALVKLQASKTHGQIYWRAGPGQWTCRVHHTWSRTYPVVWPFHPWVYRPEPNIRSLYVERCVCLSLCRDRDVCTYTKYETVNEERVKKKNLKRPRLPNKLYYTHTIILSIFQAAKAQTTQNSLNVQTCYLTERHGAGVQGGWLRGPRFP